MSVINQGDCSVARLNKIAISLCALLFTSISFTPLAQASGHTHASASPKALPAKSGSERKKKSNQSKTKTTAKTTSKSPRAPGSLPALPQQAKPHFIVRPPARRKNACCVKVIKSSARKRSPPAPSRPSALNSVKSKCVVRKGYKKRCKPEASEANLTIADAHKVRVQKRKVPR